MDRRRWDEIQAAFDSLVELDAAGRAGRLAALGTTDPELRAVVESLLAADGDVDTRLAPLDAAFLATAGATPDPFGLAGRTVSHFRILEPLGAGGMGVVYRAEDTRLGRAVALKFLLPQTSLDPTGKARFLHEARAAAALDHPNLCTVHEVGESDDGRLFLAMALYPGETLKARLVRDGPLPVDVALDIARQIAQGLAYAHAAGIVHRDLKPGNVMLIPGGPVKILDFGLAKARDETLSASSSRLGTAAYMAPEQIRGEAVDARADLWALGVVLYEMLTGRKPFGGEHEVAIAHAILHNDPVPPSKLRAEVPAAVEDVVLTLLQTDPAKREAAVERLLLAESGVRSARTRSPRARRLASGKRRWTVAVSIIAAVGIVGVLAVAGLMARRNRARNTEAASRVAVVPFENRTGVSELDPLGPMTAEWVTQGLTEVPFLTVLDTRGAQATARTLGTAGAGAAGRETGAGVVVAGSYFLQGDSLQFQAQIASTADGSVLLGIGGVTAPRDRPMGGIEQVRQRVLGGLASVLDRDVTSFQTSLRQPPTYAAWREYVEGLELYMGDGQYRDAAERFYRAALLDSAFLTARVWAAQSGTLAGRLWMDETWARRSDSLLGGLELRRHRLAPFNRARLDFVAALRAGDHLASYRAALRMQAASPGSVDARREVALTALRSLRPREALRRLKELDPERGLMREWLSYWFYVAWGHHLLGQYEEELAAARRGQQLHPSGQFLLYPELRALAVLGRIAELDSLARAALPVLSGQAGLIAFGIAGELMAHGQPETGRRLAQFAADFPGAPPPSERAAREWIEQHIGLRREIGDPYCYLGEDAEARSSVERAREEWLHWRAELALLLGDLHMAASHASQLHAPAAHGLLHARILVAQGKPAAGRAALEDREALALQTRGSLRGLEVDRASLLVRLGDLERALEVMAEGLARGAIANTSGGQDGHAYPDLAPLWGDPRFRALIKPKG